MVHAFALRFRCREAEPLFVTCAAPDAQASSEVRRVVAQVMRERPDAEFDGMIYHYNIEQEPTASV